MEAPNINLQLYDLTGQVSIVDGIAKFNGNYSSVLLGAFRGQYVAIKVIKATSGQQTSTVHRKLLREVIVWGSATHQNIHPFYGVANDQAFGPFGALISPWCRNGDASQYLAQHGPNMVMAARMNLWKGVIEGIVYLHGRNPPIVHGDLKPGNVLIDDAGKPRICDFGLARIFDNLSGSGMTTTSEHTGTTRYLAPELVMSDESVSPTLSSDVYALGCLGLEFIFLQTPFSHRSSNRLGQIKILQDLRAGLPPSTSPAHHTWPSRRIWPIVSGLWSLDPVCRSSALTTLQVIKRTGLTLPPNVIRRVITFVDADYNIWNGERWEARIWRLRSLCLVSSAYCTWATPALYRHIWLSEHTTATTLFALNYSLNNSIISPLRFNQVADGYGAYTESLIVSATEDPNLQGMLSSDVRALLHMMPHLRLVSVGGEDAFHSLATLGITYYSHDWPLVDPSAIIPAFSYLQRLSIFLGTNIPGNACPPAASLRLYLPHLLDINIYTGVQENSGASSHIILEALSGWKLPSLQRLIIDDSDNSHSIGALVKFLRIHGALLRDLTLDYPGVLQMWQSLLTNVFTLCTNLCVMRITMHCWAAFWNLPSHPNLERLCITSWGPTEDGDANIQLYEQLMSFKATTPALFPKLVKVEFARFRGWKTFFHTGDDFITVQDENKVSRYYEGGRIEIGVLASVASKMIYDVLKLCLLLLTRQTWQPAHKRGKDDGKYRDSLMGIERTSRFEFVRWICICWNTWNTTCDKKRDVSSTRMDHSPEAK